jgi:hypothetical protein
MFLSLLAPSSVYSVICTKVQAYLPMHNEKVAKNALAHSVPYGTVTAFMKYRRTLPRLNGSMIPSPFRFEENLTPEDFLKIGQLSFRWSHTEHIIANCLKIMLRLSDKEAVVMIFPLSMDLRLQRIDKLRKLNPLPPKANAAFDGLRWAMGGLKQIRNTVVHAVMMDDARGDALLELRSKERSIAKAQVFDSEELTNYAAHAAIIMRHELGEKDPAFTPLPLPDRPSIPVSLRRLFATA